MAQEPYEQKGILILSVTTLLYLFSYRIDAGYSDFMDCLNTTTSRHPDVAKSIEQCVPYYKLFKKHMKRRTGDAHMNQTAMSLVGAYNYGRYSVVTVEAQGWYGKEVYCRYLDANLREIVPAARTVVFPEFVVYCCAHGRASYMSVTQTIDEAIVLTAPLERKAEQEYKYNVSFCLAPIYGNNSVWLILAEMIEYYKLQGVEHFFVYVKDIEGYSEQLLIDYVKSGYVEVVYFKSQDNRNDRLWQLVGVEDCLYKNRNLSRYLIYGDLDERMTPVGNFTIAEYISNSMEKNQRCGSLNFDPRWVLRTSPLPTVYQGEDTLRNHLPTLVYRNTSAVPPQGDTAKYALDPNKVILAWVHDAAILVPGFESCYVPTRSVYIRHYRELKGDYFLTRKLRRIEAYGAFEMIEYPVSFQKQLLLNVKRRLDHVYRSKHEQL